MNRYQFKKSEFPHGHVDHKFVEKEYERYQARVEQELRHKAWQHELYNGKPKPPTSPCLDLLAPFIAVWFVILVVLPLLRWLLYGGL